MKNNLITFTPILSDVRDDWSELVSEGMDAAQKMDIERWRLGMLASRVERAYGDESMSKYAAEIGVRWKTLYGYQQVFQFYGGNIPHDAENLSWSHCREAMRLKDQTLAIKALTKAADRDWIVGRLGYFLTRYLRRWHGITPRSSASVSVDSPIAQPKATATLSGAKMSHWMEFRSAAHFTPDPRKTYRLDVYEVSE